MTDEFVFAPAKRENVGLLIGLAGASGAGKTKTALELATGLSPTGKIAFLDTEARRGLHYAPPSGDTRSIDELLKEGKYRFYHADFRPPFTPQRFVKAIKSAEETGAEVVIIDSTSHEYDGEGGILDWAAEIEEGTPKPGIENPRDPWKGDGWQDWSVKPVKSPGNWKEPKLEHKKMMNEFLQARCHLIFCLRADEKIRIYKGGDELPDGTRARGTVILPMGWVPICEKRFMFEMTLSLTLRPDLPGKPDYSLPHKIQDQHRSMFPEGKFITREAGRQLAAWAAGGEAPPPDPVDTYAKELGANLRAMDAKRIAEWWSETTERRDALRIPADRLAKMDAAVAARIVQKDGE